MRYAKSETYFETSALLRAALDGDGDLGDRLDALMPAMATQLTWLEADRSIRRAAVTGRITPEQAARIRDQVEDMKSRCHTAPLGDDAFERATIDFPVEPIRTADALHLGAALFLRDALDVRAIASCDDRLRANAKALGFELIP